MATSKYSLGVGLVGEEDARRPTLHAADVASASLQHRNPMTLAQLEERMRGWLTSGEYRAVLFEDNHEVVAYVLFPETDAEIYLRQFSWSRTIGAKAFVAGRWAS